MSEPLSQTATTHPPARPPALPTAACSEDSSQAFELWAGAVLEQRGLFEAGLAGRRFAFSLLAHADHSSPMLDFLASSSVLQVRCPSIPQKMYCVEARP